MLSSLICSFKSLGFVSPFGDDYCGPQGPVSPIGDGQYTAVAVTYLRQKPLAQSRK